jgi:hypothetical protein
MDYQSQIQAVFSAHVFERPLFYSDGDGLRFGLSEGGTTIEQFLLAMAKATEICRDVFDGEVITVCLRFWSRGELSSHREVLSELRDAGVSIPRARSIWFDEDIDDDSDDDGDDDEMDEAPSRPARHGWVSAAFTVPVSLLPNLLWCAIAKDLCVRPSPRCLVYLFNLEKQLAVFPYDDRGMDIVGPNFAALEQLYVRYEKYLLGYDRAQVDATFLTSPEDAEPEGDPTR